MAAISFNFKLIECGFELTLLLGEDSHRLNLLRPKEVDSGLSCSFSWRPGSAIESFLFVSLLCTGTKLH